MALPLENCVVERNMPKGYTWAKVFQCWTGDPKSSRFFEENEYPAAYFTWVFTYYPEEGWVERQIKFQGSDAVWAQLELSESAKQANISCEGHLHTRTFEGQDGPVVVTTINVKQGSLRVHSLTDAISDQAESLPLPTPTNAAESLSGPNTAISASTSNSGVNTQVNTLPPAPTCGLQEWPEPIEPSETNAQIGEAPF